jgi:hypothetical protein
MSMLESANNNGDNDNDGDDDGMTTMTTTTTMMMMMMRMMTTTTMMMMMMMMMIHFPLSTSEREKGHMFKFYIHGFMLLLINIPNSSTGTFPYVRFEAQCSMANFSGQLYTEIEGQFPHKQL